MGVFFSLLFGYFFKKEIHALGEVGKREGV